MSSLYRGFAISRVYWSKNKKINKINENNFNALSTRPLQKVAFFAGVNSNFELRLLAIDSS